MDSFGIALRQSISDHLGHQAEVGRLRLLVEALGQASNLTMIQSRGGNRGCARISTLPNRWIGTKILNVLS